MQLQATWQYGSSDPENADHFATISQWWASLDGKEIIWRQRLVAPTGNASELNWETQRFDEKFVVTQPQIRGITLYWSKPDLPQERSMTPHKLELDSLHQQLYIFPQSQKEVVIQVAVPQVAYQKIQLSNPQSQYDSTGQNLVFRDDSQKLEVKISLSPEALAQLKQQLP